MQLQKCTTTEDLRRFLDSQEFSFRFDAGLCMPSSSITIEQKDEIARSLVTHFVVHTCKAELDQLKEGLVELDVLSLFVRHRESFRSLLVASGRSSLSPQALLDLFEVCWSLIGSNQRETEESVIFGWTEYVHGLKRT